MVDSIDIKTLNLNELAGVINAYPWYGGARQELCARMTRVGAWTPQQYAENSLYMGGSGIVSAIVRAASSSDCTDKDVQTLLKACLEDAPGEETDPEDRPDVIVVGGDYFSRSQYDKVRREGDGIFSTFAAKAARDTDPTPIDLDWESTDFCTETLGRIYEEQGYLQEAKDIYSKLSLRYPEKSVYFAALIEKIDNK